jgi:hypothetical protein
MRKITDEEKKKAILLIGSVAGGAIGSQALHKYAPGAVNGFPATSTSVLLSSSVMPQSANPVLVGVSLGRIVDYLAGRITGSNDRQKQLQKRLEAVKEGKIKDRLYETWDTRVYNIPTWLPVDMQYDIALGKIRRLIKNTSYDRVEKKWVPPGMLHPAVVYWAKQVVKEAGDGRELLKICQVQQRWTYDHVPWTGEFLGDEDMFMHPGVILESMDESGKCMPVDCDCQAALNCSMLMAVGLEPYFVLIGQSPDEIGYNHIICAVKLPEKYHDELKKPPMYFMDSTQKPGHFEYDNLVAFKRLMIRKV